MSTDPSHSVSRRMRPDIGEPGAIGKPPLSTSVQEHFAFDLPQTAQEWTEWGSTQHYLFALHQIASGEDWDGMCMPPYEKTLHFNDGFTRQELQYLGIIFSKNSKLLASVRNDITVPADVRKAYRELVHEAGGLESKFTAVKEFLAGLPEKITKQFDQYLKGRGAVDKIVTGLVEKLRAT